MLRLRRSLQREEGQALVIACLMVLVLALAVLSVVNIGHAVEERIRLQNTADAAAYSRAAMEARAFNFYSFANRTQASQYVSAMVWQSFDSFIFFMEAFITDMYGLMRTLDHCGSSDDKGKFWDVACPILENLPYIGPLIKGIDKVLEIVEKVVQGIHDLLQNNLLDRVLGKGVSAHRVMNQVLAAASQAVMYVTMADIGAPGSASILKTSITDENDPNLGSQIWQSTIGNGLTACMFDRAHYLESNGGPLPQDHKVNPFSALDVTKVRGTSKIARAKRVMAGISNATRFGCDTNPGSFQACPDSFVTDRRLGSLLSSIKLFGINAGGWFQGLLNKLPKWGQTRLLTYKHAGGGPYALNQGGGGNADVGKRKGHLLGCEVKYKHESNGKTPLNQIREWVDPDISPLGMMAQGDDLGSDDVYTLGIGPSGFGPFNNPFTCDPDDYPWSQCWGDPRTYDKAGRNDTWGKLKTSIWALNDTESPKGGIHWRVTKLGNPDDSKDLLDKYEHCALDGPRCHCIIGIDAYVAHVRPVFESWHRWNGIVPFTHFEPGDYRKACAPFLRDGTPSTDEAALRNTEFNQPSAWVMFNKKPKNLRNPKQDDSGAGTNTPALLNPDGQLTFHFGPGAGTPLVMDDTIKGLGIKPLQLKGMTVFSRAQVYYHRPGDWAEMPNFFNPYWRPRLASVYQGRYAIPVIGKLLEKLPGILQGIPQKVMTH